MLRKNFLIIILLFVVGCSENKESDTPAQEQIEKYSKKLEDCQENAAKKAEEEKEKEKTVVTEEKKIEHVRGYGIEPDDIVLGERTAKIVLVEYFSPTCPHCVTYNKKIFPQIKTKYIDTGKIAYVVREFIGTKQDLDATILARCNNDLQSYLNFKKVILEQQDNWAFSKNYREILTNIGTLGGVSPEKYAACLNDGASIQTLMENTRLVVKEPKFVGTPSFFINGVQFTKPYTFDELSAAIDDVIANVR